VIFEIVNVALPVFDTFTVCDDATPTFTLPNATLAGETEIAGLLGLAPLPLNPITTLGVEESFTTVTLPERLPGLGGTIFALKVLLWPGRIVIGNETPVTENPNPAAVTLETVSVEALGFVIVSNWDIVTPTVTVPNATFVGKTVMVGLLEPPPVPLNATTTDGVAVLLVMMRLPDSAPIVGGAKLALNVTLCSGAICIGNDTPETEKPVPDAMIFEIVSVALPELVIVSGWESVTPIPAVPKLMFTGETDIPGCPGVPPVPFKAISTLGAAELFAIVMLPESAPAAGGIILVLNEMF